MALKAIPQQEFQIYFQQSAMCIAAQGSTLKMTPLSKLLSIQVCLE
jgi:hypothetical protein